MRSTPGTNLDFLAGGGVMGKHIRAYPWAQTSMGEPRSWPQSLRTAVRLMLATQHPMFIFWGAEHTCLYNDAYSRSLGTEKHPAILGAPGRASWQEIWPIIGPQIEQVMRGEGATWHENQLVPIIRHGGLQDVYWTYGYSPIDEPTSAAGVGGVLVVCTETTEQVKAERRLLAERERFVQLFDQAPTFLAVLRGADHVYELVNPGYQKLIGPRAVVGRRLADALPEAVAQGYLTILDRVYSTGEAFLANDAKWIYQSAPDGPADERYLDFVYQPIVERDGSVSGILVQGVDVTERKKADQALGINRARLDYATRLSGIGFWYCDLPFDELKWDETVKDHFFFQPTERITITDFYARIHEEDRELTRRAIDGSIINRTPYDIIYRTVHPTSGVVKWIRALGGTDYGSDGTPIHFDGVTVDVTAQKQIEMGAQVNAQRIQLALAAGAIIGTWFWDIPTNSFTADEPFALAFGLDPARCREGIPLADVVETVHPDDQAGLATAIEEACQKGGPYSHQYRVRRADGRYYWIEANGRVDHRPDGTPLSFPGVLIDVEKRRAVEAERDRATAELYALNETLEQRVAARTSELLQAEEQLRQSQKMEAVGQLTGGLAHDFNNLLTGITGSLEMLNARLQQGRVGEVDRYVHAAQGAAKRAAGLTHRLLAFSRRQTLDPKPTDINRLVAGMSELLKRTIGPEISLEAVAAAGLWSTLIDPGQLENALLNLCINARDAMPNGGKLTIETGNKWLDERAAKERDVTPGQYVSLCVSDTGTGMSQATVGRAFDPFFTTKPIGMGTGLGLSMVYGFARQSGGQVRIYSEVDQGTMVCLYLPRNVGDAAVDPDEEAITTGVILADQTESVLVVDDEPTVRMLVVDVLQEMGCIALEAADGATGLKILNSGARIDLLVTDVGLPGGMNGRQLADAARVARPDLEVLFITGYAENAVLNHGHLNHGMHVMTKPFTMEDLARRVKTLLAAHKK